jgi:thiamine-monophosphate kinase
MNEAELIARLTRSLPSHPSVVVGAGDDCAVLDGGLAGQWLLFKTDAVVEGVHFLPETPGAKIGHKALARCLSDIAAMAGTPTAALITLGLPRDFSAERVEAVYAGMSDLARRHALAIAGGETTASPGGLFLSLAVLGTVAKDRCILRRGAQPGDAIFVTGELGGSLQGRHLDFEPRLSEARWLAETFSIHALIDLSDGLAGDLRHVLTAGAVGGEILKSAVPVSRAAKLAARTGDTARPAFAAALTDGEDFELLFTVASADAVPLLDAWKAKFPSVRLSCVGKITREPGLRVRDERGVRPLLAHGYDHFDQPGRD